VLNFSLSPSGGEGGVRGMVGANTEKKRKSLTENRERAKSMRHEPVNTEKLFWFEVRSRKLGGFKFKRQVLIGKYIVDFACLEERLIVELDGLLHADRTQCDANRDDVLRMLGYRVLRFTNDEVGDDFAGVLATVLTLCGTAPPHPDPLPRWGRGNVEYCLTHWVAPL